MANNKQELIAEVKVRFASEEDIEDIIKYIEKTVNDNQFGSDENDEWWVEVDYGQPGDLEPMPCVVRCNLNNSPGCITASCYSYIAPSYML